MRLTSPAGAILQLAGLPAHTGPSGLGLLTEPGGCLAHSKPFHPTGSSFTIATSSTLKKVG